MFWPFNYEKNKKVPFYVDIYRIVAIIVNEGTLIYINERKNDKGGCVYGKLKQRIK